MEDFDPDLDFEVQQQVSVLEIDPAKYQHYIDVRRTEQHLPMAAFAGVIGAMLGAGAWLGITSFTSLQVGWMAVAVGAIVGGMVRVAGQGIDREFGFAAMLLTLVGCAVGMLLAGCWLLALESEEAAFADLLFSLTPGLVSNIFRVMLTPVNMASCGGGMVLSYWFAIRRMRREEMARCAVDARRASADSKSWAA